MSKNKAKISDDLKEKVSPKNFTKNPIKGTKFTVMISSAKGGVGKSTFSINLLFALQKLGYKVGLLDADIHGPSLPKMIGLNERPKTNNDKFLLPLEKYGAQFMSLGFLVDEKTPMIWRGPMVAGTIKTLAEKVLWKDLDFLIIDMPPGTGDTQLTFAQDVKIDGAIIISTPQELALMDVTRGIQMFNKVKIKILGLVENMSFFKGDDGKSYNIFGEDGVEKTAKEFDKKFLGKIPINTELRKSADLGLPLTYKKPDHEISKIFADIALKIKQDVL
jgi:ATP-binding protein involved in chromosome partitioning